jgi:hypothetical protein
MPYLFDAEDEERRGGVLKKMQGTKSNILRLKSCVKKVLI